MKNEDCEPTQVLAICGSLQRESANLELLHSAAATASASVVVVLFDGLRDLPLFNQDLDGSPGLPAVEAWRRALRDSDAVLLASPEYGHSLSGPLKNAIDWVIRSGELYRKPVAITASVSSAGRGARGLAALRQTLEAVDASIVGGQVIVRGPNLVEETRRLIEALVERARDPNSLSRHRLLAEP